jgi:SHS2 domain-containing protein
MQSLAGYQEIAHTADWELHVWAPDMPALLEQAALGTYALMGTRLQPGPRQSRRLEIDYQDKEDLLVSFLAELLLLCELENLGFDTFDLRIEDECLIAHLSGTPITSIAKEIKAVTYHNLVIRETAPGLETNIVFDV